MLRIIWVLEVVASTASENAYNVRRRTILFWCITFDLACQKHNPSLSHAREDRSRYFASMTRKPLLQLLKRTEAESALPTESLVQGLMEEWAG